MSERQQPDLPFDYPAGIRPGKKVLIVDPEEGTAERVAAELSSVGCVCRRAASGEEALGALQAEYYDLVILAADMPGLDGFETCRRLRLDPQLPPTPVILIGSDGGGRKIIHGFEQGADDFVGRPYDTDEFVARVKALLVRSERHIGVNPLTQLPGNLRIRAEIERRIRSGEAFAVYYLDVDEFKAYNDKYGYDAGDDAIRLLARILIGLRSLVPLRYYFVGHIGGDDFVLISDPQRVEDVCEEIIRQFDAAAVRLYNEEDRRRGYSVTTDRRGQEVQVPLMRLSIGVVTNERRALEDPRQVAEIATETKQRAKQTSGSSSYYIDQRRG